MIEAMLVDAPQFQVYSYSVSPIVHFYKEHTRVTPSEYEIRKLLPYAKQTDFILITFHEIVDDLNYDKEKFEKIIYTFDDDYDMLKDFLSKLDPKIASHQELLNISQRILSNLMKAQNELGIIISQNEHNKI